MQYDKTPKKKIVKNDIQKIQPFRLAVQSVFMLIVVWIGVEFWLFVNSLSPDTTEFYKRPEGVDGFLPISALMSLWYWIQSGKVNMIHPSGLFIFIAIIAVSVYAGKSFCSWLCPIGTISEMIAEFGEKITGRRIIIPKWLDWPLRSLKYLLLGFFLWAIIPMSVMHLQVFLNSPYNKVADIKLYNFFVQISTTGFVIILLLFIFSTFIRGFWCRYLCPYGALLGVTGLFSPVKITRNSKSCIDCGLCAKACPSAIKVDKVTRVFSDECTMCLSCVDICPVKDTLYQENIITKRKRSNFATVAGIVIIYTGVTGLAILTGFWQNTVTEEEYRELYQIIDLIGH
ncbi:MAG: hypothetical protein AMXMBFR48_07970 [Ignavibacteriales bacterium]